MKIGTFSILLLFAASVTSFTQPFTRADSLRGFLFPERTCYDVKFYDLRVRVYPMEQFIEGSNRIVFSAERDFDSMQIDLHNNLKIDRITDAESREVKFTRELNAVFVKFPVTIKKGSTSSITVFYVGKPKVSINPPWDDGFVWRKDTAGNYRVGVTCQGAGASVWWPNKDHQSDEPDSMQLSVTVPKGYMDVSNGRLRSTVDLRGPELRSKPINGSGNQHWTKYTWFVSYPINNYNVTVNIGKYKHIHDAYVRAPGDSLDLDYYVVPENESKAKEHFQQVKPMIQYYEKLYGRYPFERDGYKLVETSYPGMEHQSAISYGNKYENGYFGRSRSGYGKKFDYIIIHESAHEWWGNSITTNDIADLWVHEGFATYSEALYVETFFGYDASLEYINTRRKDIQNKFPVIGPSGVNTPGYDVYLKTALILNTLRSVIDNDSLWFQILHGIQDTFKYKTIDGADIIKYIESKSGFGSGLDYFFDQYFRYPNLPELEIQLKTSGDGSEVKYKWNAEVPDFRMPVEVTSSADDYIRVYPRTDWQTINVSVMPPEFKIAEDKYLINVKKDGE